MIFKVFLALLWAAALAALLASAWTDLKDRIIPNELVGLVAAVGLALSLALRPETAPVSLAVAALTLFGLGVLAHYGMMGGGDVKMISATTLLFPPGDIGQLLIFIAVAGGVLSCVYLLARKVLGNTRLEESTAPAEEAGDPGRNGGGWLSNERARAAAGGPMPYALAILGGVAGMIAGELQQCLLVNFCSF